MAEGFLRHFADKKGKNLLVRSAGIEAHGLNKTAVNVMLEAGVDISGHKSKIVEELKDIHFDLIITVCDHANDNCPAFSSMGRKIHRNFTDPSKLVEENEDKRLNAYRSVRDEISQFCSDIVDQY
jgi:arsenate reductase